MPTFIKLDWKLVIYCERKYLIQLFESCHCTGPLGQFSLLVAMSVSHLSVCAIAEKPLPSGLETSCKRAYRLYWHAFVLLWFLFFNDFLGFDFILVFFLVCSNQPTVHNGGVSRVRVCGCGCGDSER